MNALVITAMSTRTESHVPEYRFARVSSGATSCAHLPAFATPKPTDIVQVMKTYQTTATTAAVRIARGIARRGSAASSPSTAAASKPMKPVKAKTTARNKPCVDGSFAGLSGWAVTPESPPFAKTMMASSRIAATPAAPSNNWVRVDSRMSKNEKSSNPPSRKKKHWNQLGPQLVCGANNAPTATPPMERTNEIPM